MEEGTALPCGRILINKHRRNHKIGKSPLGKHQSNNYCKQEPSTDTKISGQQYDQKQDFA